jgi:hypothetical protein
VEATFLNRPTATCQNYLSKQDPDALSTPGLGEYVGGVLNAHTHCPTFETQRVEKLSVPCARALELSPVPCHSIPHACGPIQKGIFLRSVAVEIVFSHHCIVTIDAVERDGVQQIIPGL